MVIVMDNDLNEDKDLGLHTEEMVIGLHLQEQAVPEL
jgi:hypothetical protein